MDELRIRQTWVESDRLLPRAFVRPTLRFMSVEAAGGAVMLAAAVVAVLWANSPWRHGYEQMLATPISVHAGTFVHLDLDLHEWTNEAAMTLFFLLAGLEIKRQVVRGELRDPRRAALPALAALGGMLCPALLFALVNAGHDGARGWGIPMATDIAFAVGVVTLAGRRLPVGARIFILTLAVADDVGGIVVIAVFYSSNVRPAWFVVLAACVALTLVCSALEIRSLVPYLVLGTIAWYSLYQAGVEAAIAGVIFGLLAPTVPFHPPESLSAVLHRLQHRLQDGHDRDDAAFLARYATETVAPLERIESRLGPWVSFLIVPVFALANAGVRIDTSAVNGRVFAGVIVALVLGKLIGVFAMAWLAVRLGLGRLPSGASWSQMAGLAATAGIGFTVALFVTELSFDDPMLTASAKLGVLCASAIAGVVGALLLKLSTARAG